MHFNAISLSHLAAVIIPISRHISGEKTLKSDAINSQRNYATTWREQERKTEEWLVAPILVFNLQKKSVKGSVNTLGSMYAIKAEYKYSHVWLSEKGKKKKCISKTLHAQFKSPPPPPSLYRFHIKLFYLKVFKLWAKKLSDYFWLTHFNVFSLKYIWSSDFGPFLAQHINTTHGDGKLAIWFSLSVWVSMKIKGCRSELHLLLTLEETKLTRWLPWPILWLHNTLIKQMLNCKRLLFM